MDEPEDDEAPELRDAVDGDPGAGSEIGSTGRVFGYGLLAVFVVAVVFAILYVVT